MNSTAAKVNRYSIVITSRRGAVSMMGSTSRERIHNRALDAIRNGAQTVRVHADNPRGTVLVTYTYQERDGKGYAVATRRGVELRSYYLGV